MATIKQKQAFDKIVENHGNVSKTMIEVGYDPTTAKNPKNLTESKGWRELMEEVIPDSLLADKHRELLTVPKKVRTFIKGDLQSEYEELDSQAISKGLDMAYKLKGSYAAEKSITVNVNVEELRDLIKQNLAAFRTHKGGTGVLPGSPEAI